MITNALRSAAILLGAIILSVTLGGQPALAQSSECPCLTSEKVDGWFSTLPPSTDLGQKPLCVDDPGFTTFDYLDPPVPGSLIYIDLRYETTSQKARCVVDLSPEASGLVVSHAQISKAEANACRTEILNSQVWSLLGCPKH